MTRKITITEIAKIAGVNPSTVSRALNPAKSSHLSEELRTRIKDICDSLNYRPQVAAKGFAVRKSYRIGLLLGTLRNDIASPVFSLFIQGICDSLQNHGYTLSLLWCECGSNADTAKQVRDFLLSDVADGYIMGTSLLKMQCAEMFEVTGRPIVALANHPDYEIDHFHQVKMDVSKAMADIWHLMPHEAYRKIVFFSIFDDNKDMMIKKYAPADANIISIHECHYPGDTIGERAYAAAAAEKHWETLKDAGVIWCASDLPALGVCDLCRQKGLIPGKDILIIGRDNIEETCRYPAAQPYISTIDPNWEEAGRKTGDFILRCLNGKAVRDESILCEASFVPRETFPYQK